MIQDTDLENPAGKPGSCVGGNEGISDLATPTQMVFAYRSFGSGTKIAALPNQIGLKYYFVAPKICDPGSPRVTLLAGSDGEGRTDFAVDGHVNPLLNYTARLMNQ